MDFLPFCIPMNSRSFSKNTSERSIDIQKHKLTTEQNKAHRSRLLEENNRRKIVLLDKSLDKVLPPSYYVEKARQTYLKRSLKSINSSPSSVSRLISERQITKKRKAPVTDRPPQRPSGSVYPEWLLSKPDFVALVTEDENACSAIDKIVQLPVACRSEKQSEALKNWLYSVKYFQALPRVIVSDLSKILVCKEYNKGSALMYAGEVPDFLFVVYSGLVGVYIDSQLVATCGPRNTVGEVAFDSATTRTATCKADEFTQTFVLDRKSYTDILENIKKLEKFEYNNLILSIKFFEGWTVFKIQALSACLMPKTYKKGEVIFEKDSEARLFLILKSGKVNLQTDVMIEEKNRWPDGMHKWKVRKINKQYIADVGFINPPCYFGEMDLINGQPRKYRAIAVKKCECALLNKKEFFEIFTSKDIQRLKEMNKTDYPTPRKLHDRILNKLNSKRSKRQAIIDAMEVDVNSFGGRQLPFIKQNLRIKNWIETFREKKNIKIR